MKETSLRIGHGGTSAQLSISSTSAQTATISATTCVIYSTVDCFARWGTSPTALSDGTDQFIPAATLLRIELPAGGGKLAFKTTSASGTVSYTPGA